MYYWLVKIQYADGLGHITVRAVDREHAMQRGLVSACLQYSDVVGVLSAKRCMAARRD